MRRLIMPWAILVALAIPAWSGPTEDLDLFTRGWPRAFFFRASEGMASNPRVPYGNWEAQFGRLSGIEGKVLDEEIPGRSRRNIEFFTRFKQGHPRQLVLLHYNGNARDPRDRTEEYFAGHWVYWTGCALTRDLPAEEGESELYVKDASLFRTNMGRYQDKNEDIGLRALDEQGRADWTQAEQVRLLSVDARRNVLTVRRGCFGTRPRAFKAGQSYAAAHATEGPWGKRSNLMWFYNFTTHSPRDPEGKRCIDRLVDELAEEFAEGGRLAAFDGVEFDVLNFRRWQPGRAGRGIDTDGDSRADWGYRDGVNVYGIGVYEFCRQLRERLGDDILLLADGHSPNSQRGFGQLNGIESEGWPNLADWEMKDWSGGLNRHLYWDAFGRKPAFSYFNHKYIDGKEGVFPQVPMSRHRLALAAAQLVNAAVTYSFAPPRKQGEPLPIWDELWKGAEQKLGWLGEPVGPAHRLAMKAPDLLEGRGRSPSQEFVNRFQGDGLRFSLDGDAVRIDAPAQDADKLRFTLPDVPCDGPDLFVAVTMRGAPRAGYPAAVARLAHVGIKRAPGHLISRDDPPRSGMQLRGQPETELTPDSGAAVRYFPARTLGGTALEAYFCHPPWRGTTGLTFWERDVDVPADGLLQFAIGMGVLSPERSDGVVFRVLVRADGEGWQTIYERLHNEFRWQTESISLARWGGKRVALRFVTDAGPKDNSTTDHSAWGNVRVVSAAAPDRATEPVRYMTLVGTEEFESTFAFRRVRTDTVDLEFTVEGTEPVWLSRLSVHAAPDAILREYDNGCVLANPSYHPVSFDLAGLLPGKRFQRIQGTELQDPVANNGQPVGATVTLSEREGLFLAKVR